MGVVVALTFGVTVFFQVETVTVNGSVRYTPEEVVEASGIQIGDNLYRFNKNHISSRILQSLPYVEGVSINRKPPSTIVITVTEFDAIARLEPPAQGISMEPAQQPAQSAASSSADGSSSSSGSAAGSGSADGSGSASSSADTSEGDVPLEYAHEAWLISPPGAAGCKLLEPAPANSSAIPITGIAAVSPKAGTILQVAPSAQAGLDALTGLLGEINERGELGKVNSIAVGSTEITLGWMGRFQVRMALNADFHYKMRALEASITEVESLRGEGVTGILDMTDDGGPIRYSPYEE